MSRNSNSHFEGAIILDDDGQSANNTGPISYIGFDKSVTADDESEGPRISGRSGGIEPPTFEAPQGSMYLPGLGQFVWHNVDGTTGGWVRLLQEGSFPPTPATPSPTYEGVISIDLPDTGAVLSQQTTFPFPATVQVAQVLKVTYYKLEAAGTANVTIQPNMVNAGVPEPFHAAPIALNVGWAAGFMDVVEPSDLFQTLTANVLFSGTFLRIDQVKALAGENNAVRVVIETRAP